MMAFVWPRIIDYFTVQCLCINPNQGGGANMPQSFSNTYTSGTECWINLKPGCKFKLVCCLKGYKKIGQFGPSKDPGGPFFTKGPLKLAPQGPFWGPFEGP